jgi:TonB family protein
MSRRASPLLRAAALAAALAAAAPALEAAAQPRPAKTAPRLTKAPKLVTFVEAAYPEAERAAGRTATVVLQVALSATGTVDDAVVQASAGPAFDAAALAAVRRFVFTPAELDGQPGPVKIVYRYAFTLKPEAPTTAVFDGLVRTRKGKQPLAGVTVELDSGQRATTDATGRFHVEGVPPGAHAVALAGEKLTALRTEETFAAGQRLDATYEIEEQEEAPAPGKEADDLEIVVTAPPLRKQVVSTEVSAEQARRVPGTAGDVLKVVENLPGVARSTVGSGALVVWGAAPEDTRIYIDGVRVPRLYHDGGLRSVVHSDLVRAVDLAPGGWGAGYGRALGGLVTVDLRPLDEPGFHGSVAADAFDGSGAVRAALGDRVHVAVALRKSWLDALLPLFTRRDVSSLFPGPRWRWAASSRRTPPSAPPPAPTPPSAARSRAAWPGAASTPATGRRPRTARSRSRPPSARTSPRSPASPAARPRSSATTAGSSACAPPGGGASARASRSPPASTPRR